MKKNTHKKTNQQNYNKKRNSWVFIFNWFEFFFLLEQFAARHD